MYNRSSSKLMPSLNYEPPSRLSYISSRDFRHAIHPNSSQRTIQSKLQIPTARTIQQQQSSELINLPKVQVMDQFYSVREKLSQNNEKITQIQRHEKRVRFMEGIKNPRDREIIVEWDGNTEMECWLGKMMQRVTSEAFEHFFKKDLTFNETRILCCNNFLKNIIDWIRSRESKQSSKTFFKMDQTIVRIIDHLCNKYPQTYQGEANKRLKEVLKKNVVNNYEDSRYDLLAIAGITFVHKNCSDYSKQIMLFLNYLLSMPFLAPGQKLGQSSSSMDSSIHMQGKMPPFRKFHMLMSTIFEVVYKKDIGEDYKEVVEWKEGEENIRVKEKVQKSQEQIQYQMRVKSYTKYLIGTKFSQNTPFYSEDEIQSGNVEVKTPEVRRILIKWLEEMGKRVKNAQKEILQRSYRFKGKDPKEFKKINSQGLKTLYQKIRQKEKPIQQFKQNIHLRVSETAHKICNPQAKSELMQLQFLQESQKVVGDFAVKMSKLGEQCVIKGIEFQIHTLLSAVEETKQQWLEKNDYYTESPVFKNLNIDLITFKIGDIMRCKCMSHEDEILRIFEVIRMMSDTKDSKLLKIIRVKDRLSEGTRDILINVLFDQKCICEIQLAVMSQADQSQAIFDKFNHFLYEIKRSQLGPIMQICNILMHIDPKARTFKKALELQSIRKRQNRFVCYQKGQHCPNRIQPNLLKPYDLPFICSKCNIFFPYQKTIFKNKINVETGVLICGECISKIVTEQDLMRYIWEQISERVRTFSIATGQCQRVTRIKCLQKLKDCNMLMMIPINSRIVNMVHVFCVLIDGQTLLVDSKLSDDGKKVIYSKKFVIKQPQDAQRLFQNYIVYASLQSKDIQLKVIDPSSPYVNDFVTTQMLERIADAGSGIKILLVQRDQQQCLFPFFCDGRDLKSYFEKEDNLGKIKKAAKGKVQVLDMNRQQLTDQFRLIKKEIKVVLYSTLRELYINENRLGSIEFVEFMVELRILYANSNQIAFVPDLPESIEQVELGSNLITEIRGIGVRNTKLWKISFVDNQIEEIKGLDKVPSLVELPLYKNKIKKIQNLNNLPNLQRLTLASNSISILQNLQNLPSLELLNLCQNPITNYEYLNNLPQLRILYINRAQVKLMPKLHNLTKLQSYIMSKDYNEVIRMENLEGLSSITVLNFSIIENNSDNNHIIKLEGIKAMKNLTILHLSYNEIKKLEGLEQLRMVRRLIATSNQIEKIQGLDSLNNLQFLALENNKITIIEGTKNLFKLKKLYLSENRIKVVENIDHLTSLQQVRMNNNEVVEVKRLPRRLEKMDLSFNKLNETIWSLNYPYVQFKLDNNPISKDQSAKTNAGKLIVKAHDLTVENDQWKFLKPREEYRKEQKYQEKTEKSRKLSDIIRTNPKDY